VGSCMEQCFCIGSIDGNVGFEGFVFVSRWSYMVGGVGNFDGMVGFFLCMVGTAGLSSSPSSSSSSISSLVVPLMMIFGFLALDNNRWRSVQSFHNSQMPLLSCVFLSHGVVSYCTWRYCVKIVGGFLGCCFWSL